MVPQRPTPGNTALPHSSTVRHDAATAVVAPTVADAVTKLLARDVASWHENGLECIKRRTVRRVFRGELDGVPVHIKVFRADTIAAKARDAMRRAKGEREAANLQQVREFGLPAVESLGYGMANEGGELCSFVITRTIASRTFSWAEPASVGNRVGQLLRRVHELGLQPGDLHPGNVLVDEQGDVHLCDLTSLRRAGHQSLKQRAMALAFFCNPLDGGALDAAAAPMLRGYLEADEALPEAFSSELRLAAHRWRATALRSFGKRYMRSCRHTETAPRKRAVPRWFWFVGEDGASAEPTRAACRAFDGEATTPVRTGRRGSVWLQDGLAVKRRDAGKARRLWHAHYLLLFAGVPTATPLALCLHGGRGHVFVRRLANDDLVTELADGRLDTHAIAATAHSLGTNVGRLHGHGLRNRDLKFDNLVRDPATGDVHMVDLDGVRLHGADDSRGCGRDLGRLLAAWNSAGKPGSDSTLRRFLAGYCRARRDLLQAPPMKRILRRAVHRAGEWASRHAE